MDEQMVKKMIMAITRKREIDKCNKSKDNTKNREKRMKQ